MVWKKRLSEEDSAALQAEMQAALDAAKASGIRFPTKRLHELTGINKTYLWKLSHGRSKTTLPMSNKIRDGLRAMLKAPAPAPAPEVKDRSNRLRDPKTDRRSPARAQLNASLRGSQAPTRARLIAFMQAHHLGRAAIAERSKVCHETSLGYFLGGAFMRPKNYQKLVAWLDGQGAPPAPATPAAAAPVAAAQQKKKITRPLRTVTNEALRESQAPMRERLRDHLASHNLAASAFARRAGVTESVVRSFLSGKYLKKQVHAAKVSVALDKEANGATSIVRQPSLPFPETGSVIAVAARMHSLRIERSPIEARQEGEGSARTIALSVLNKLSIEAVEALIKIAKSSDEGE